MKNLIKDVFRWLYWYPFRLAIQAMPLQVTYKFCSILAVPVRLFSRKSKAFSAELAKISQLPSGHNIDHAVERNLHRCVFVHLCKELETLQFPRLNPGNIKKNIRYQGLDQLDLALKQGRGVMLLFAHFGANQMIMPAIGHLGYKMTQIGVSPLRLARILSPSEDTSLRRRGLALRWELEKSLPATIIDPFRQIKKAFTCLRNNEILGIAMDGGAGGDRIKVTILDQHLFLSKGAVDIALRTNCVVLPTFMVRDKQGFNTMIIESPMEPLAEAPRDELIEKTMGQFLQRLEWYVLRYPSHYIDFLAFARKVATSKDDPGLFGGAP